MLINIVQLIGTMAFVVLAQPLDINRLVGIVVILGMLQFLSYHKGMDDGVEIGIKGSLAFMKRYFEEMKKKGQVDAK